MLGLRIQFCRSQFLLRFALGISLLLSQQAIGQASYAAQVRGTVTDPTGAVVANATVTIINDGANVSTTPLSLPRVVALTAVYSVRNAANGSIFAARRAGMNPATTAAADSTVTATIRLRGS